MAIGPADLELAEGSNTVVYAWGNEEAGYELAVQTIGGSHSAPSGVPGGTAGLVDDESLPDAADRAVAGRPRGRRRRRSPAGRRAAAEPHRRRNTPMRPAAAAAVLGLALAVGTPTAWALTRPPAAAGAPVVQALPPAGTPCRAGVRHPGGRRHRTGCRRRRRGTPARAPRRPSPLRSGWSCPPSASTPRSSPVGVSRTTARWPSRPTSTGSAGTASAPRPAEPGSAVLAGHVDDAEQGLGAMAPLREAAVGDEIMVTDADGATTRWRVVARELIRKQVAPAGPAVRPHGPPRLTLITCGGPFLPEFRSYRDNVVVVAEPLGGVTG